MRSVVGKLFLAVVLSVSLTACGGNCIGPWGCEEVNEDTSSTSSGTTSSFTKTGSGDSLFTLPSTVSQISITASYTGLSQTFFVDVAGKSIVIEGLGTGWPSTDFYGEYVVTPGGLVEITDSAGVAWSISAISR